MKVVFDGRDGPMDLKNSWGGKKKNGVILEFNGLFEHQKGGRSQTYSKKKQLKTNWKKENEKY